MTEFNVHTLESAPERSKATMHYARKKWGFIPNIGAVLAESPVALEAYVALNKKFEESSLSPSEQNVVLLTASRENGCEYCVAAYSTVALMQKVQPDVVEAIRNGTTVSEPKLEALSRFTSSLVKKRGWVDDDDIRTFLEAGYAKSQVMEVLLGVTFKTMSTYLNHFAKTPLDAVYERQKWISKEPTSATDE